MYTENCTRLACTCRWCTFNNDDDDDPVKLFQARGKWWELIVIVHTIDTYILHYSTNKSKRTVLMYILCNWINHHIYILLFIIIILIILIVLIIIIICYICGYTRFWNIFTGVNRNDNMEPGRIHRISAYMGSPHWKNHSKLPRNFINRTACVDCFKSWWSWWPRGREHNSMP